MSINFSIVFDFKNVGFTFSPANSDPYGSDFPYRVKTGSRMFLGLCFVHWLESTMDIINHTI